MKYRFGALEAVRAIEEGRHALVEVRWRNAYDGPLSWHKLSAEANTPVTPFSQGVFPLQAEYRVRDVR